MNLEILKVEVTSLNNRELEELIKYSREIVNGRLPSAWTQLNKSLFDLIKGGNILEAVKTVKDFTGWDLRNSKLYVDMLSENRISEPQIDF